MKKHSIYLLLIFCTIISCKKEEDRSTYKEINATVLNTGKIAVDGCGWLIKIDSTKALFSPENLSELYQTDSLAVVISYNLLTTKFQCGLLPGNGFSQIRITAIRNKNAVRIK